ncbi:hypothetical protein [Natronospora cellulosivora (SeqCode)]
MLKFNNLIMFSLIMVLLILPVTATYAEEYNWDEINKRFIEYMENGNEENANLLLELLPKNSVSYEERLNKPQAINDFFTGKYSDDLLVASGDVVNINIIFRLRYLTDGAHASELDILLGSLITKYPENFLLALEENIDNVKRLDAILLANTGLERVDRFDLQLEELQKRYNALNDIDGIDNEIKDLSLDIINKRIQRNKEYVKNSLYGSWEITDTIRTAPIYAMNDKKIDTFIGKRIEFQEDLYYFHNAKDNEVLAFKPRYNIELISELEF